MMDCGPCMYIPKRHRLAVASLFRDSMSWHGRRIEQVPAYFRNWERQFADANAEPEYFCLHGDSADDTEQWLNHYAENLPAGRVTVWRHDTGSGPVSSAGADDRRRALSGVGNACLRKALAAGTDLLLWTESDLVPGPGVLKKLLEATEGPDWSSTLLVAPVTWISVYNQKWFYDAYAFEGLNGERWQAAHGWTSFMRASPTRYRELRSVGCAALMNARALRAHKLDFGAGCFPELCRAGRAAGHKVLCDNEALMAHPSSANLHDRWV